MEYSILLIADIIITALILCALLAMGKSRPGAASGADKDTEEALLALRKGIENLEAEKKEMAAKHETLNNIINRLDGALADVHSASERDNEYEADYSAARNLLKRGEPVEKVIEMFNITRGEADVLTSINAMAS
jgi:septal ring factor EnvC (AmiA/AmiB activator)